MIQATVSRLTGIADLHAPVIICNEHHRFMIAEQLRELDVEAEIILEPAGRNTAPAVAAAASFVSRDQADPTLLVLPADHHIGRPALFRQAVVNGLHLAEEGMLVTFGIEPTAPETGYGYIRKGAPLNPSTDTEKNSAFAIGAFVEKPDRPTAEKYLTLGAYLWNSGMFLFKASTLLEEAGRFAPRIVASAAEAVERGVRDLDFFRLEKSAFEASPADSIDYAVMEHTDKGAVVPLSADWSDVGSWDALLNVGDKDIGGNVTVGDVHLHDVHNSYIHAGSRLVTALGVDDHIIVETADAVLFAPRKRAQEVSRLVSTLKESSRPETLFHRRAYRPWGWVETLVTAERYRVKHLLIRPGARISFQRHNHRAEHWIVVRGTAHVQREDELFILKEDESTYIPIGARHRLANPGKIPLEIIEVRTGSYLEEDDVERFEDDYGR
jgi:mannose-1-phosphate guanylyltransferase/mannose-6-phosphate isomerase